VQQVDDAWQMPVSVAELDSPANAIRQLFKEHFEIVDVGSLRMK
jgi:hypothetical protein